MVYNVFTIRWVPVGHILQYCGHIAMACSASSHILINDDNLAQSTDGSSTQPEAWMRKWVLFRNGLSSVIHVLLYANHKTSIFNLNCNVFFLLPGVSLNLPWNHWKQTQYNRWGTFVFFAAIRPKVSFSYWIAFAGNVNGTISIWKQSHLFGMLSMRVWLYASIYTVW